MTLQMTGCSMLERLMNWKLYKKDHNNKFNPSYVTKLVRNYRSHPAILHVPNKLFYESELIAIGGAHTDRAVDWKKLPKPKFPVIFHAVNGKEGREPRSPRSANLQQKLDSFDDAKNTIAIFYFSSRDSLSVSTLFAAYNSRNCFLQCFQFSRNSSHDVLRGRASLTIESRRQNRVSGWHRYRHSVQAAETENSRNIGEKKLEGYRSRYRRNFSGTGKRHNYNINGSICSLSTQWRIAYWFLIQSKGKSELRNEYSQKLAHFCFPVILLKNKKW